MEERSSFDFGHHYRGDFERFHGLMSNRVNDILLVSSLYDYYILAEDGGIYEAIFERFMSMGLNRMPGITRVSTRTEAIQRLSEEPNRFDLIIMLQSPTNPQATKLAREVKLRGFAIPVVLLAWENKAPKGGLLPEDMQVFDKVFVWQGDFYIFLAIVQYFEDQLNIERDTRLVGVQSIIVMEDDPRFYSSFLPMIYREVLSHTNKTISEGINPAHRQLRMRCRPKVLLCSTYEEGWEYFEKYHSNVLGIVCDVQFPRKGQIDKSAGFRFYSNVKATYADIPIVFQSRNIENQERAESLGGSFVLKESPLFLKELRTCMSNYFGFGDFIFRLPDGSIVGRANDLRSLEEHLQTMPAPSVWAHAMNNDFSRWLKVRTEYEFANKIRAHNAAECESAEDCREFLTSSFRDYHKQQHRGNIIDFDSKTFDPERSFAKIGTGSLGGKARGIAFSNSLINFFAIENSIKDVEIKTPSSVVLCTGVFDEFVEDNELKEVGIRTQDDQIIMQRFLEAEFRSEVVKALIDYLQIAEYPLAVRSSGLLEDSYEVPFAGVYSTYMLPNNAESLEERLNSLLETIKRVFASTYCAAAKDYIKSTPYRLEEEKMAVIIQQLVGSQCENRFYPHFSGTARSHNFYPIAPMTARDGISAVALGLGRMVAEGGRIVHFCPKYPKHVIQFSCTEDVLAFSQNEFYALDLDPSTNRNALELGKYDLTVASKDGRLDAIGSIYSMENHSIYDNIERPGSPLVTFAPILKYGVFPLATILRLLLSIGRQAMNSAVEMEFAVTLSDAPDKASEFFLLQVRPAVGNLQFDTIPEMQVEPEKIVCRSSRILGHGVISNIQDIVTVDTRKFERKDTREAAREFALINSSLSDAGKSYLLITLGRLGSSDPWLGVPVAWSDISGARAIVEAEFEDIKVTPSQGTHFFHNVVSSRIGYFTIKSEDENSFINWDWFYSIEPAQEEQFVRHISLPAPLTLLLDGKDGTGIIACP